jgi:hypothetical protein
LWQRLVSLKIPWDFAVFGKVMRNKGRWMLVVPSVGYQQVADICFTLTSKTQGKQPISYVLCRGVVSKVGDTCFYGFSDLG